MSATTTPDKLSRVTKFAFGVGDLGPAIVTAIYGFYLNYFLLPERPRKQINIALPALTVKKQSGWKPPVNHPWRTQLLFTKKQPMATVAK